MPNIEDDIRKAGKRLKALRKTASAHKPGEGGSQPPQLLPGRFIRSP